MDRSIVYSVNGIILKRRDSGEADRILTVLTLEFGKIRVIARGVRRILSRRASQVEIFSPVKLVLHKGRALDTVTEASRLPGARISPENLKQVGLAYFVCEIADRLLPEYQREEAAYILLKNSLTAFSGGDNEKAWEDEAYYFSLKLLWSLGYLPPQVRLPKDQVQPYIEKIIEKKLRSVGLLTKFQN